MNDDGRPPKEPATATNIATATAPATGAGARLDSTGVAIDFGELLLGTLELAGHENTAIGYADTAAASPSFITGVGTPANSVAVATALPDTADVYFSVNAVRPRQPGDTRRGSEADVTRLTALYADLDVKPGGCPTLDVARQIADEVGIILGSAPAAFVESGHGLHPYWVIEDGHVTDGDITAARSLVHRFGRLVAAVAKNHRVAVDGVYDLARMLRVPGTLNNKNGADGQAAAVVAYRGTGRPLSMAEVAERLDEVGIEETDEDRVPGTEIVSPPTDWRWAETTCGYVAAMIGGWATDTPNARNPWHYANRIRLECARRNRCITEADYRRAEQTLADRLTELVATTEPRRPLKRLEIAGAAARAVGVAAAKSDDDIARELGRHNHAGTAGDFWGTGGSPAVGRLEQANGSTPGQEPDPDAEFWESRDSLRRIRDYALACMVAPWGLLGVCLPYALDTLPWNVHLPGIGDDDSPGSLSLFVALASPSGSGKGRTVKVARRLMGRTAADLSPGSGEGLVKCFVRPKPNRGDDSGDGDFFDIGADKFMWVAHNVVFNVPEIDTLVALTQRSSATLPSLLRQAFSGEQLGLGYADDLKRLYVPADQYRLGMIVGVQPGNAGPLFADETGGTPQRFAWLPATDPRIRRDNKPDKPDPLVLTEFACWRSTPVFELCDQARDEIELAAEARGRGEVAALDSHALFVRAKIAAALAVLNNKVAVSDEDWRLSGAVMDMSDRTRSSVQAELRAATVNAAVASGKVNGLKAAVAADVQHDRDLERVVKVLVRAVVKHGPQSPDALRKRAASRDRKIARDALDFAVERGLLTESDGLVSVS